MSVTAVGAACARGCPRVAQKPAAAKVTGQKVDLAPTLEKVYEAMCIPQFHSVYLVLHTCACRLPVSMVCQHLAI